MNEIQKRRDQIVSIMRRLGYPDIFALQICDTLKTEKAMRRMVGYLLSAKPSKPEMIADEMVAILEEHAAWRQKKITEYNNAQYNMMLLHGLPDDDSE